MSIVTRTGDTGTTGLYGGGRISKADARMHAIGTVDELNAAIGLIVADEIAPDLRTSLITIQNHLFRLGADLATPIEQRQPKRIEQPQIAFLDALVGRIEPSLPQLQWFILPGGSRAGALLHQARAVCRRAERWMVAMGQENVHPEAIIYANRLSDLLFLMAREANRAADIEETRVSYENQDN
jgi:cob(I)alamin adenosyltransferase